MFFILILRKWDKYLKAYKKTVLENNFYKLLEALKDSLKPKDENLNNRPDCEELLKRINEFSLKNCFVSNQENIIISEFIKFIQNADNFGKNQIMKNSFCFLKKLYEYKIKE